MKNILVSLVLIILYSNIMGAVNLILPNKIGGAGTQVTVPIKVKDFTDIVSVQGTIQFDQTKVTYVSVQQFGLPGMNATNFGTSNISSGKLTFVWYDGTLAGIDLPDSTVIFSIIYNLIGTNGQVSPLTFVNSPTQMEVVDITFNPVTTTLTNGSITIQNTTTPANVSLLLDNVSGTEGSQIHVSLEAVDFTNINSIQGTIQFDPAKLTYSSISFYGLPGMNSSNFGVSQVSSGKLTFVWYDPNLEGINMTNNTPLFTISFTALCNSGNTSISLVNIPTTIEVTDSLFNTVNTTLTNGSVNILPLIVSAVATPNTICNGQSTSISATGATTYSWMPGSLSGTTITPSPTSTTTYAVTGTSSGCTATSNVTVTVNNVPIVDAGINQTICSGTPVTLSGNGATSYTWDNGVTNGVAFNPAVGSVVYTVTGTTNGCSATDQVTIIVNAIPTVDAGTNQTICFGTPVILSGSGATTYTWDNGITDGVSFTPSVGTIMYTVTGTTTGCSATDQVTVVVNAIPNVDAGTNQTICFGTPVTLSGSGALSYTWDNGVSDGIAFNQAVGSIIYTVTGTTNECSAIDQVTVVVNEMPSVTTTSNNAGCGLSDGSATANASGGTGIYTYLWDTNAASQNTATAVNLSAGVYYVTVDDGNCSTSTSATINENGAPAITLSSSATTICAGDTITLTATGADTYLWTPNNYLNQNTGSSVLAIPPADITYQVQGTTSGCSSFQTVTITVNQIPIAGFDYIINGTTVVFTDTSDFSNSWNWNFGDGNTDNTPNPTYTYATDGNYTITQIVTNSCSSDTATTMIFVTYIQSIMNEASFQVYPNPFNSHISIFTNNADRFEILNLLGETIYISEITSKQTVLDLNFLHNGIYLLKVSLGQKCATKMLVKE
jgi:PKD repeat protein